MCGGARRHPSDDARCASSPGFQGEDDPEFFNIGSRLVIAASIPLAIGISGDVAVVFFKTTGDGALP